MNDVPKASLVMFAITSAVCTVLVASGIVSNVVTEKGITNLYITTLVVAGLGTLFGWLVVRKLVLTRVQLLFLGQLAALIVLLPCLVYLGYKILWGAPSPIPPDEAAKPIVEASAYASRHQDCNDKWFTYQPTKADDGNEATAWRVPKDGQGQWIRLEYTRPVEVSAVGIIPGHDKIDQKCGYDRFKQLYVVRQGIIEFSDGMRKEAHFERDRSMQFVTFDPPKTTEWVRIEITGTYPPRDKQVAVYETAISEIEIR